MASGGKPEDVSQIARRLKKPFKRWARFSRDVALDSVLVLLTLFLARILVAPNARLWPLPFMLWVEGLLLAVGIVGFLFWRGLYSINVRYVSLRDFLEIASAGTIGAVALLVLPALQDGFPTERHLLLWPVIFGLLCIALLCNVRVAQRIQSWRTRNLPDSEIKPRNTFVVGAGDAGEGIVREIARSTTAPHNVVGLIDDDPLRANLRIRGIPVVGTIDKIPQLVRDYHVEEILIAMPTATGEQIRRITHLAKQTNARAKILPQISSILAGRPQLSAHLRDIAIEDLLRRDSVTTDLKGIGNYINGERVLITGGGGSIGSELARQVADLSPAGVILVGRGENSLYEIEQELLHTRHLQTTTIVCDVRDRVAMEALFARNRPSVVFHAAAHKHVPLMQGNPIEAIRNNVLGTWQTAELAAKAGARHFLNVSTDKAVKPSSVMGATKRVGEMIVQAMASRYETEFAIVRFGNVLGSRGSLVPLLQAQIKRGGPVRVTHPEMTRYFMTIPEAVQLILQAGALGQRGEIYLLDMGSPIKILDLAMDLIHLEGFKVGEDIEIQYTGIRPGEKIHEELLYDSETLRPTTHPKIQVANSGPGPDWELLKAEVLEMLRLCELGHAEEAQNLLFEIAWGKTTASEYTRLGT